MNYNLPPVWRIEGRANPFVPWVKLGDMHRIEDAAAACPKLKKLGKYYAVRVRAN